MQKLSTVLVLASLASCSSIPGLGDDARSSIAPYVAFLEVKGKSRMQFINGPNVQNSNQVDLGEMGLGKRDEDVGLIYRYGDGFSGLRFEFLDANIEATTIGVLPQNWGALVAGDNVQSKLKMDEFKFSYLAQLWGYEDDEAEWWFKVGAGLSLAHRTLKVDVREINRARTQFIEYRDQGVPSLALKIAGGRGPFSLTGQLLYNDDFTWGGDFINVFQDLELRFEYAIEDQDIKAFAGYRQLDLQARDADRLGLDHATKFRFSGFMLGLEFGF